MIRAEHRRWARLVFNRYIDSLLRKHFTGFYQVNAFPPVPPQGGLLILPNHMSWWDGFFIDYVCRHYLPHHPFYIMMLEKQLQRYWFFKKLGAYSINPGQGRSVLETMKYTLDLLSDTSAVVMFPQGVLQPYSPDEYHFEKGGLRYLVSRNSHDFHILPVAFKIQYYEDREPEIACRFGIVKEASMFREDLFPAVRDFDENIKALERESLKRNYSNDLFDNNIS